MNACIFCDSYSTYTEQITRYVSSVLEPMPPPSSIFRPRLSRAHHHFYLFWLSDHRTFRSTIYPDRIFYHHWISFNKPNFKIRSDIPNLDPRSMPPHRAFNLFVLPKSSRRRDPNPLPIKLVRFIQRLSLDRSKTK